MGKYTEPLLQYTYFILTVHNIHYRWLYRPLNNFFLLLAGLRRAPSPPHHLLVACVISVHCAPSAQLRLSDHCCASAPEIKASPKRSASCRSESSNISLVVLYNKCFAVQYLRYRYTFLIFQKVDTLFRLCTTSVSLYIFSESLTHCSGCVPYNKCFTVHIFSETLKHCSDCLRQVFHCSAFTAHIF